MKTHALKITRYRNSETSKWVVTGAALDAENGKRTRKFFPSLPEAETWRRKTEARLAKEGHAAITMPEQLRIDAVVCAGRLNLFGKTLKDATDHYLTYLVSVERSITVAALVEEFKTSKDQDGASDRYKTDLKSRLKRFVDSFGDMKVAAVLTPQIDDWLRDLGGEAQSRNNFRTVLNTLFEYAILRQYATENPVERIPKAKVVRGAPEIFTPAELRTLLEKAPRDLIPHITIGAFAGLRTAEIERLDWSEINFATRRIHVKAEKAKSAQRRLVTITENLAAWLAPLVKKTGLVAPHGSVRIAREKVCEKPGIKWPANGLRHSFASYHLASHQNAALTADQLGHASSTMLFKHYRELVEADAAASWWQIVPPADYGNVLAFDKAANG